MKFNMKTDMWVRLILWGCILMFLPVFFVVEADELYILILSTLFMAILILPLFASFYELDEDDLVISMYFIKKRIPYDKIKSIRKCENFISSAALSKERIEIIQHNKSALTSKIYISPVDREEFYSLLKNKCHNLDMIEDFIMFDEYDQNQGF